MQELLPWQAQRRGAQVATHTLGQSLLFLAQAPLAVIGPTGLAIAGLGGLVAVAVQAIEAYTKNREEIVKILQGGGKVISGNGKQQHPKIHSKKNIEILQNN